MDIRRRHMVEEILGDQGRALLVKLMAFGERHGRLQPA